MSVQAGLNEELKEKLRALKKEFETGNQQLNILETRITELRKTLLRISGAIQVLEELNGCFMSQQPESAGQKSNKAKINSQ